MYELIIVGGGPAGLAAACAAWQRGLKKVLIIERDVTLGGILNQCIHPGFGLHTFREELTGPEYAGKYTDMLAETGVETMTDTIVLEIKPGETHTVVAMNPADGLMELSTRAVILAMGCRERTRGAIAIPGDRPAGVLTAGTAQRYINLEGYQVGRRVVILGSGDIGLIMARRLTLEGAKVLACVEVMPFSSGLTRNIVQCLDDFHIPLYLSHTVTDITSENGRVKTVTVAKVDGKRLPVPGTEMVFECDTLLLSVGLIPENELTAEAGITMDPKTSGPLVRDNMETDIPGIFACGNVVHVHDLVDNVSAQSVLAGQAAADFVLHGEKQGELIAVSGRDNVTVTVPQRIRRGGEKVTVLFRSSRSFGKCVVKVTDGEREITARKAPYMTPGETQSVTLTAEMLNRCGDRLQISVYEGGEEA